MANELIHKEIGTVLTEAEYDAVDAHVCNSQATGDLIYASSASQLSRLGIGATNAILTVIGGVPTWQSTLAGLTLTSPTINGTIDTTGLEVYRIGTAGQPVFQVRGYDPQVIIKKTDDARDASYQLRRADNQTMMYLALSGSDIYLYTPNAAGNLSSRLIISCMVDTAVANWSNCKHVFDAASLPNGDPSVSGQLYYTAADGIVRRSA